MTMCLPHLCYRGCWPLLWLWIFLRPPQILQSMRQCWNSAISIVLQCVQKKRTTYFQTDVTPFKIDEISKAGRALKRAGAELSNTYDNFSGTQLGAEIFEFKVDPSLPFEEIVNSYLQHFLTKYLGTWSTLNSTSGMDRNAIAKSCYQLYGRQGDWGG